MKTKKRTYLLVGLIINVYLFAILLVLSIIRIILATTGNELMTWLLLLIISIIGLTLSAVGIGVSSQDHDRYLKNHGWVLPAFIFDCLCSLSFFMTMLLGAAMIAFLFDFIYFAGLLIAAAFIMSGYVKARDEMLAENEGYSLKPLQKKIRPLMLAGEIVATVAFGLVSIFYLYMISVYTDMVTSASYFVLALAMATSVFSAMGIDISASNHNRYQKKRGFVLVSFIVTCVFAGYILLVFVLSHFITFGALVVVALLSTAATFIMVDYAKTKNEEAVVVPIAESLGDIAASIEKFDELRKSGVLTQEEFEAIKAKHLEKIK